MTPEEFRKNLHYQKLYYFKHSRYTSYVVKGKIFIVKGSKRFEYWFSDVVRVYDFSAFSKLDKINLAKDDLVRQFKDFVKCGIYEEHIVKKHKFNAKNIKNGGKN